MTVPSQMRVEALIDRLAAGRGARLSVRLPDGAELGAAGAATRVVFHDPAALDALLRADHLALAEAFMDGRVDVEGELCEVVAITDELDHYMMLPTRNRLIQVEAGEQSVRVRYRDREWVFPRGDCVLLPLENTTAELLARYIAERLLADLKEHHQYTPQVLRVEVEENVGQSATCELRG